MPPITPVRDRGPSHLSLVDEARLLDDVAPVWELDGDGDGMSRPSRPRYHRRLVRRTAAAARRLGRAAWRGRWLWPLALAYATLGWWLAARMDLVVLDSLARASHAGFVWHNGPPKLAGIGFAWPPMTTLPLLPLTAVPALAKTGLASTFFSSIVMASVVAAVVAELRRQQVPRLVVVACGGLLAVHPMLAYYGANGMSEALGVLFVTLTLVAMLRWIDTGSSTSLSIASFAAAAGMMSRYELGVLPVLVAGGAFVSIGLGRRDMARARALAIFALVPAIYGMATWMYFNWVVQGSPTWFLTGGYQLATISGTASTIGDNAARSAMTTLDAAAAIMRATVSFAPLSILVAALTVALVLRRRYVALLVAAIALSNVATSLGVLALTDNAWMAQLRFNIRTVPASVVAAAWMLRELGWLRLRASRYTALACVVAGLALALPMSYTLMRDAPLQFTESSFLEAVAERRPLTGTTDVGGQTIGCESARRMGAWIADNVTARNAILADTSSTFGVLTYSGHPERFVDPIDHGSAYFIDMLNKPVRRIDYVLTSDFSACSGVTSDLLTERYPDLHATGNGGRLRLVHEEGGFRLHRLTSRGFEPRPTLDGGAP